MNHNIVASTRSTPVMLPANNNLRYYEEYNKSLQKKCSVCSNVFNSNSECLRHELLTHSLKQLRIDSRIKAAIKFLNTASKLEERTKIHNALQRCPRGEELSSILKLLCIDDRSSHGIFTCIEMWLQKELSSLGVVKMYPYGSIDNGLALKDSDVDIYMDITLILTPQQRELQSSSQSNAFNQVNQMLHRSQHFVDVFALRRTRVPIIRCKHIDTGFKIDINISHRSGMENSRFIRELVLYSDSRIRELLQFLKLWAKNKQIIVNANMNSHCFITMAIFYLQQQWIPDDLVTGRQVPMLKPVMELQSNCSPLITVGVNYAFDLQSPYNRPKIPRGVTTFELIKGFFRFYKDYNYELNIISPFYGKSIPKVNFTTEKYWNYANQLETIMVYSQGVRPQPFAMDVCMCVQDPFALNQNLALLVCPAAKKYFMLCLQNADDICQSFNNSQKIGEVLEKLLYEAVVLPVIDKNDNTLTHKMVEDIHIDSNGLSYCMNPGIADFKYIEVFAPSFIKDFKYHWCNFCIADIPYFFSNFYHIDMQKIQMQLPQNQQHLDNANLTHVWHISTTVDLWTNRSFQKTTQQTLWEYQMAETERLYKLRRQDANFLVNLNALLNVRVLSDSEGIIISVTLVDGTSASVVGEQDPLRQFFNSVKITLQNYNLKDSVALQKYINAKSIPQYQ